MAYTQINEDPATKSGLGKLLGIIGGIGSAALAIPTGGASLIPGAVGAAVKGASTLGKIGQGIKAGASIAGAASGGAALGSQIGNMVKPGAQQGQNLQTSNTSMKRRSDAADYEQKMNTLRESATAAMSLPQQQVQQYMDPLMQASQTLQKQRGGF